MREPGETGAAADDEISLLDILRWVARWWWLVAGGCVVGSLLGLTWHFTSEERFTVRLDMAITESPVGTAAFVREISTGLLRRHLGTPVAVEFDQQNDRLSLVERGVRAEEVAIRRASMQSAAAELDAFLDGMVSREYARMQDRLMAMESDADVYASLSRFRVHVSALQEGLLKSVVVVSEGVERRGPPLAVLLVLCALGAAGLAAAAAVAVDALGRVRAAAGG